MARSRSPMSSSWFTWKGCLLTITMATSSTTANRSVRRSPGRSRSAARLASISPHRIVPVLEQTHPGQVTEIIDECREPLEQQVAAARQTTDPLEPADFMGDLLQAMEEGGHADIETAQNALSMSFEYGLILAHVQRSAALVLRNAFNRAQEEAAQGRRTGRRTCGR